MTAALPVEKLRAYLTELTPEARGLVLGAMERAVARGESPPGGELILDELRRTFRAAPQHAVAGRTNTPARLFFAPLEPFLVDDRESTPAGRISRAALDPVWQWICRDLVPADAKVYGEELERGLGDDRTAVRLVRAFQDLVAHHGHEMQAAALKDDRVARRLAGQIGTPRALDDLRAVLGVLRARDALALIGSRLPAHIRNLADDQLANVKALLDSPIARHPDIFVFAMEVVMGRLTSPWQLIRLAVKAADSDAASKVAATPYAVAVTLVLGDVARMVAALRRALTGGKVAAAAPVLKDIHDAVRAMRTEMDLSGDSPWVRELAAQRGAISNIVKVELDLVPGRVRRLLRPRAAKDVTPGLKVDATEVAETEGLIEFVNTCRNFASELAINEVTLRVHSDIRQFLDTGTPLLLDGLRTAGGTERTFRMSQVEAAIRFAGKLFGPGYAALLAKAADVALNGERKAVKG